MKQLLHTIHKFIITPFGSKALLYPPTFPFEKNIRSVLENLEESISPRLKYSNSIKWVLFFVQFILFYRGLPQPINGLFVSEFINQL